MCTRKIKSVSALQKLFEEGRINGRQRLRVDQVLHPLDQLNHGLLLGQDLPLEKEGMRQIGGQARGQGIEEVILMSKQELLRHGSKSALVMRVGDDVVQTVLVVVLRPRYPLGAGLLQHPRPVLKPIFRIDHVHLKSNNHDPSAPRTQEATRIHQHHVELIICTRCQSQINTWKLRHHLVRFFTMLRLILQLLLALQEL